MTTIEFKDRFRQTPESYHLSGFLQSLIFPGKYNDLFDYIRGFKEITSVSEVDELYRLKGLIFMLKADCKGVIQKIDELNFDFLGEFEDTKMDLTYIGINPGDEFECTQDYLHNDMILIKVGSTIRVNELKYAGKNSLFTVSINYLMTENKFKRLFPNTSDLLLALTFSQLQNNFSKIGV